MPLVEGTHRLPVADLIEPVAAALATQGAAVVIAPPGSGKSTVLPPGLLDSGILGGAARMLMLQPRRVAARAVARRIAEVRGGRLGDEIGYRVRFDDRTSKSTRLEVLTEGLLTRRLQSDPFLDGVDCVVLDEFHERSLHADLALALLAEVRRDARPDLKLLVMSATLDPGPVAAFLSADGRPCPVLEAHGRAFPVEVEYEREASTERVADRVNRAVRRVLASGSEGHVLVFLPGKGEIADVAGLLSALGPEFGPVDVLPLHGGLSPEAQDRALSPPTQAGRRKVVLATNLAETSVTIEGVTSVIDSGQARVPRFESRLGLERLERVRISRASADQRAGRAGRTAPGRCLRLWTQMEHAALSATEVPEILRTDLSRTALELRGWGADPRTFRFFEAPDTEALEAADALLRRLGLVDARALTPLGQTALAMPLHPRLAAVVVAGHRRGVIREVCAAAALLNERDVMSHPPDVTAESDLTLRLDALRAAAEAGLSPEACRRHGLDPAAAREVMQVRDQLMAVSRAALGEGPARSPGRSDSDVDEAVLRSLLAGFEDRVAQRRAPRSEKFKLANGGGAVLDRKSVVREAALILAVSLDAAGHGTGGEHRIRVASALSPAWLPIERAVETRWDEAREAVVQARVERHLALTLAEHPAGQGADPEAAAVLLAENAARAPARAFDLVAAEPYLARVRFLAVHMPELVLPDVAAMFADGAPARPKGSSDPPKGSSDPPKGSSDPPKGSSARPKGASDRPEAPSDSPPAWLAQLCAGRRSFADLRRLDLSAAVAEQLSHAQRTALERHAPERMALPAGRTGRLTYSDGEPPVLSARLQWFFGLDATPTVADGRVRVRLHLLAPNGRPAQVTQDLAGFWRGSWALVRKELRGRYPKHAWPEDPSAAWRSDE